MYEALELPREIEGMLDEVNRALARRIAPGASIGNPLYNPNPIDQTKSALGLTLGDLLAVNQLTPEQFCETAARLDDLISDSTEPEEIRNLVHAAAEKLRERTRPTPTRPRHRAAA